MIHPWHDVTPGD